MVQYIVMDNVTLLNDKVWNKGRVIKKCKTVAEARKYAMKLDKEHSWCILKEVNGDLTYIGLVIYDSYPVHVPSNPRIPVQTAFAWTFRTVNGTCFLNKDGTLGRRF